MNWFKTQIEADQKESCPTCRHVAIDTESCHVPEEEEEEEEEDEYADAVFVTRAVLHDTLVAEGGAGITDTVWKMLSANAITPEYSYVSKSFTVNLFQDNGANEFTDSIWDMLKQLEPPEFLKTVRMSREFLNSELIRLGGKGVNDEMWDTSAFTKGGYYTTIRYYASYLFAKNGASPITDDHWELLTSSA